MKLDQLLLSQPGADLMIANEPFTFAGKATVELDGGAARYWLFSADGGMLSLSPSDEELVHYRKVDEQIEPENETIGYHGHDYEFTYEDGGTVTQVEGDVQVESDERYGFTEYESDDGELIRLVRNENTGDTMAFVGSVVSEDDVVAVE